MLTQFENEKMSKTQFECDVVDSSCNNIFFERKEKQYEKKNTNIDYIEDSKYE